MASRAAGRHRDSGRWDSPSLLLLDYLESGQFDGRLDDAYGPVHGRRRGRRRGWRARRLVWQVRSGLRRLLADGRALAVMALASIVVAVIVGSVVPLRSSWATPGGRHPTPGHPRPGPASMAPAPSASASPGTPKAAPARQRANPGRTTPGSPAPAARPSSPPASPAAGMSPAAAKSASAVIVRFGIGSQGSGYFQGHIQVVNDGSQPLADWQIVVTVPGDRVIAVTNASGVAVNGVLVLQPLPGAPPVPPGGGVLNVYFVALGPQTVPWACTFDQIPCS